MYEERKQRLIEAFNRLRAEGKIDTRKDFAKSLGVNYNNLTLAMRGDQRYLTKSLMEKTDELLTGGRPLQPVQDSQAIRPGSIVIPPELAQMFTDLAATVRSQQETISRLTSASAGVEKKNA